MFNKLPNRYRMPTGPLLTALACAAFIGPGRALAESAQSTNAFVLPAVLKGSALTPLLGLQTTRLSAFRCKEGGKVSSLVFQVDEVNPEGRYVSNVGTGVARDDKPGIIDENDEIATMIRDWGTDCPEKILSAVQGTVIRAETRLPYLAGPAVAYFLASDRALVSDEAYVKYDPATDRVTGAGMTMAFDVKNPIILNEMKTRDLRGRESENIVDRLKMRFIAQSLGNMITLHVNEEDVDDKLIGVRVGPVRVIREIMASVAPVPGLTINSAGTFIEYDRMLIAIGKYNFPKMAAMFTSSMDFEVSVDFNDLKGLTVSTKQVPQGTSVDGRMLDSDQSLAMGDEPWYMASGLGLNMVGIVEVDRDMRGKSSALMVDSEKGARPPERVAGGLPELGYQFLGWENLKAKTYTVHGMIIELPGLPEGGGSGFYKAFHADMAFDVRKLNAEDVAAAKNQ